MSCMYVCMYIMQVVWATSSALGCGAFRCAQLTGFTSNALNLICNYGPAYVPSNLYYYNVMCRIYDVISIGL